MIEKLIRVREKNEFFFIKELTENWRKREQQPFFFIFFETSSFFPTLNTRI